MSAGIDVADVEILHHDGLIKDLLHSRSVQSIIAEFVDSSPRQSRSVIWNAFLAEFFNSQGYSFDLLIGIGDLPRFQPVQGHERNSSLLLMCHDMQDSRSCVVVIHHDMEKTISCNLLDCSSEHVVNFKEPIQRAVDALFESEMFGYAFDSLQALLSGLYKKKSEGAVEIVGTKADAYPIHHPK